MPSLSNSSVLTQPLKVGKTQDGQVITVSPQNHRIVQQYLETGHKTFLAAALSQIPGLWSHRQQQVIHVNVAATSQYSVGMIYDDQQLYKRAWYTVELPGGRECIAPFVEDITATFAQAILHLKGSHLVRVVRRTEAPLHLPPNFKALSDYWRNNAFTQAPAGMVKGDRIA